MNTARDLVRCARLPDEAEIILASLLGVPRYRLVADDVLVPEAVERHFHDLLAQRACHRPLQYLLRTAPFFDLELTVDERVFIPRPETEELLCRIKARVHNPRIILDICTGSGAIAIALARTFPGAEVVGTDISEPALAVARRNIDRYQLAERITLHRADLFAFPGSERFRGRVDLIAANPPYISSGAIAGLMAEVRDFEPRIALDGGPDGMKVIQPLIEQAFEFLGPDGLIALEIDTGLVGPLRDASPFPPTFEKDLAGFDRYAFIHPRFIRPRSPAGSRP